MELDLADVDESPPFWSIQLSVEIALTSRNVFEATIFPFRSRALRIGESALTNSNADRLSVRWAAFGATKTNGIPWPCAITSGMVAMAPISRDPPAIAVSVAPPLVSFPSSTLRPARRNIPELTP